jgi:hypothetical protein
MGLWVEEGKVEDEMLSKITARIVPKEQRVVTTLTDKEIEEHQKREKTVFLTVDDLEILLHEGELKTTDNITIRFAGVPRKHALLTEEVV